MVQDLHLPALDKGWAWIILVAASIVLFCVNGTNRAESIAYQVVLVHLNGRPAVSALATGLHESLRFLLGFLVNLGVHRFGTRLIVMAGSLTETFGILLSLFASRDWHFLLTFGIIGGTGGAMSYTGSMIAIHAYFEKHRVLAVSTADIFKSIGHIVHSVVFGWVTYYYGYQGLLFSWAGIVLQVCISGALCRPLEANYQKGKLQQQCRSNNTILNSLNFLQKDGIELGQIKADIPDLHSIKLPNIVHKKYFPLVNSGDVPKNNLGEYTPLIQESPCKSAEIPKIYYCFLMSVFLCAMAYPLTFIVDILIERGETIEMGSTVTGLTHSLDLAIQLIFGITLHRSFVQPYRRLIFYCVLLLSCTSFIGLAVSTRLWTTYVFYSLGSACSSSMNTLYLIILGDIIDRTYFTTGVSTLGIIRGIGCIMGPFLCGFLRDFSGSYTLPLACSSLSYILAILPLLIGSKCCDNKMP